MAKERATQIYPPDPRLSRLDKQLIRLLAEILIEHLDGKTSANQDCDLAPLTDHQAEELLRLLSMLLVDQKFTRRLTYVDLVTSQKRHSKDTDKTLQQLVESARGGKPVMFGAAKANEFKARLGVPHERFGNEPPAMTFEHYLRMERRLVEYLKIDQRVVDLIMAAAVNHGPALKQILRVTGTLKPDRRRAQSGLICETKRFYDSLVERFETDLNLTVGREQLVGLTTVVSNASVIFTSRDWDVAGTMSAICGGLGLALPEKRR